MDADPPRGTRDGELEGAANAGQAVFRAVLVGLWLSCVMAGLVPATPIVRHRRAKVIGVAGTSPAMTAHDLLHPNTP